MLKGGVDACAARPVMPERYRLAVADMVWKCSDGISVKGDCDGTAVH